MIQYQLRVSRYRPGKRQSATSTWTSISDVGKSFDDGFLSMPEYERVEQLYLGALTAMLEDVGNPDLLVSEVQLSPLATVAARAVRDGVWVGVAEALGICRLELREEVSCRLESEQFYAHVGFDFYMYIGCERLSSSTIAVIEDSGLFIEYGVLSPYSTA